jgi:hypothetical protein
MFILGTKFIKTQAFATKIPIFFLVAIVQKHAPKKSSIPMHKNSVKRCVYVNNIKNWIHFQIIH